MIARGDLNYIITAATDKDQMIGPLKAGRRRRASKSSSSTVTLAMATT